MIKYQIDLVDIIEQAYIKREIPLSEFRKEVHDGEIIDKFTASLTKEQNEVFQKIDDIFSVS